MAWPTLGWFPCVELDSAAALLRCRRRAQRGGRSVEGTTQSTCARRQVVQGERLSQRTFRRRQITQLRFFGVVTHEDGVELVAIVVAPSIDAEAEPAAPTRPSPDAEPEGADT